MKNRVTIPQILPSSVLLSVVALVGCAPRSTVETVPQTATEEVPPAVEAPPTTGVSPAMSPGAAAGGSFTLIAINDVYRIAGVDDATAGGLARVRTLRAKLERDHPDLLLLHAGDFLFPSLSSRKFRGEHMVNVMNLLDGDEAAFDPRMLVVIGNHELDRTKLEDAAMLQSRIEESQFRWLGTNVEFGRAAGSPLVAADNLVRSAVLESAGVVVGVFGLTIDTKHPAYVESFGDIYEVARATTAELRHRGAEAVVAVTHLRMRQDVDLLTRLGADGPDLIIGGHEHHRQSREVGGRWVLKADAEGRSATVASVTPRAGQPPLVTWEYHDLDGSVVLDAAVDARIDDWHDKLDAIYCAEFEPPQAPGCLDEEVGRTRVELIGEELEIRGFETNLGNYVADQMRLALAGHGAQVAFINAGALRLNQDLPPGEITRWHIEEIFQYPDDVVFVRTTGRKLRQIVDRGVANWTRSGRWLQVSGFAFRHHPDHDTAFDMTLLTPDGPRPIGPDDEILAVTVDHVANGGVLGDEEQVPYPGEPTTVDALVVEALRVAGETGIAPEVEGRICNMRERPRPCLAAPGGSGSTTTP